MMTNAEKSEIRALLDKIRQLRGVSKMLEADVAKCYERLMKLDERLLDKLYNLNGGCDDRRDTVS